MTKSELIERLALKRPDLPFKVVEAVVKLIIDSMVEALQNNRRVEIRGFGSFSLHYRKSRRGRNPKTGEQVDLQGKHVAHFKAGKELKDRVNANMGVN